MNPLAKALFLAADALLGVLAMPVIGRYRTKKATVGPLDELKELEPGSEIYRKHSDRGLTIYGFETATDGHCVLVCCRGRPIELRVRCSELGTGGEPCPDAQTPAGTLEELLRLLSAYFE